MKNLMFVLIILSTLGSSTRANASEVFKCIDENAQISFSFSPCLIVDPVLPETDDGPTFEEQMNHLESLDIEISQLNRQFRDLRLEQEHNLQTAIDIEAERQVHLDYQETTQELLEQLYQLKAKREQLVQGSVAFLSQKQS